MPPHASAVSIFSAADQPLALKQAPLLICTASLSTPFLPAATFVLEIGSEELPPDDVVAALEQLK